MKSYFMIIMADVMLALTFAISRKYQKDNGAGIYQSLFFNAAGGLFSTMLFFILTGFKPEFTLYSFIMSVVQSVLGVIYTLIGFRIMKKGGMSLCTLFLMSGGMIVPYLWGIAFLDESVSLLRIAGCIIITGAIAITNFKKDANNKKVLLLCGAVFLLNGFVSVTSKVHQINEVHRIISTNSFIFWGAAAKFILCTAVLLTKGTGDKKLLKPNVWLLILASALIGGGSSFLLLHGAKSIPATVLYPLNTGGTIVLSTLTGMLIFKEKLTKKQIAGTIICFAGTCMFL